MSDVSNIPWLTPGQQRAWRQWIALQAQLPAALNRQLQADSGLSLQDFDVLVQLTDRDSGLCRISELAAALQWERSRLSHHVKRMETRGLVLRSEAEEDGRGFNVAITEAGRTAITGAAPDHVRYVQELVFQDMTPTQLAAFDELTGLILGRLADGG